VKPLRCKVSSQHGAAETSTDMSRHANGWAVPDILKDCGAFISQFKQSNLCGLLGTEYEGRLLWNVMAHVQKPDFVFRRNGRIRLNRRGHQFSRLLAAEVCASAVVMLDTTCSEVVCRVLATHSTRQVPPLLPLPFVNVCHHISTGVYRSASKCLEPLNQWQRNPGRFESSSHLNFSFFFDWAILATNLHVNASPVCYLQHFNQP